MNTFTLSSSSTSSSHLVDAETAWIQYARSLLNQKDDYRTISVKSDFILKEGIRQTASVEISGESYKKLIESLRNVLSHGGEKVSSVSAALTGTVFRFSNVRTTTEQGGTAMILSRVGGLLQPDPDEEDYSPPSEYAISQAWDLLVDTSALRPGGLPLAPVSSGEDGGIRVQWLGKDKQVRLVVASNDQERSYIYHQDKGTYDIEWHVTPYVLAKFLDWFESNDGVEWA